MEEASGLVRASVRRTTGTSESGSEAQQYHPLTGALGELSSSSMDDCLSLNEDASHCSVCSPIVERSPSLWEPVTVTTVLVWSNTGRGCWRWVGQPWEDQLLCRRKEEQPETVPGGSVGSG